MTEPEAKAIAEDYVKTKNMRGYRAVLAEARKQDQTPNEWTVLFSLYTPEGFLMDGPMIVIVDDQTGQAKMFPSL